MNHPVIKIGIIGGQGPIASAIFVESIYHAYITSGIDLTQSIPPKVNLISDPLDKPSGKILTPDECNKLLLPALKLNLSKLHEYSPDYIIICCLSAHVLLPQIPAIQRQCIISLVDIIIKKIKNSQSPFTLVSASTERKLKVLEQHQDWQDVKDNVNFLKEDEQAIIDSVIRDVKNAMLTQETLERFLYVSRRYPHSQIILGCSELHVLNRKLQENTMLENQVHIFDPFQQAIQNILKINYTEDTHVA